MSSSTANKSEELIQQQQQQQNPRRRHTMYDLNTTTTNNVGGGGGGGGDGRRNNNSNNIKRGYYNNVHERTPSMMKRRSQILLDFLGVDLEEDDDDEDEQKQEQQQGATVTGGEQQSHQNKKTEKRQRRRSSFFDPSTNSISIVKKCTPKKPPQQFIPTPPPPPPPPPGTDDEMMWCGAVGSGAVPPPPPPPAITLVDVSGNNNMMWCGAVGTGVGVVGAPPPPPPPLAAMSLATNSNVYNDDEDNGEDNNSFNKTKNKTDFSNDVGTSIHTKSIHSTTRSSSSIGRSRLKVEKICCALETPQIKRILKPINGIIKVMINVPLKNVLIDHDYNIITASEICNILERQSFPAQIEHDASMAQGNNNKKMPTMTFVTSVFTLSSLMEDDEKLQKVEEEEQQQQQQQQQPRDDGVDSQLKQHQKCEQVREFLGSYEFDEIDTFLLEDNPRMDCSHSDDEYKRDGTSKQKLQQSLSSKSSPSPPRLTVIHNSLLLSANDLVESIKEKTGTSWIVEKNGTENMKWEFPQFQDFDKREEEEMPSSRNNNNRWPRPAVILSGIFWVISMLSFIGGNWEYLKYAALLSVALGIPPILVKAIRTLRRFQFDTNCLMLFAVIGSLALKDLSEAAAVTFLYALSDWLEVRATTRAREALSAIVDLRPETANLIHPETKELVLVPAAAVPVGVRVAIKAGDKVPCDCVVVEGNSTVDESSLTGESRPVPKGPKDTLSGGTINSGNTQLIGRVTATSEDSAVARLIRLVEEAQTNRSATETLVEEFAAIYTPLVLLAAVLMCTIPWAWGHEMGMKWTHNGLVLIVIACPCALIISTPVSYVAGLAATAQNGVLVKGGAHLEALGLVKKICFDKTGTLTQGKFQMLHLNVIGNTMQRKEVLEFLYLMEERATHPMAQALVQGAKNENVQIAKSSLVVKDHTFLAGEGVSGMINDKQVYVGNVRLFKRLGLYDDLSEEDKRTVNEWEAMGGTIGFMCAGDADGGSNIVCAYCVMDAIRPESKESLAQLKKYGIESYMLTGDQRKAAYTIGKQVGLSDDCIKSELLPEEKLTIVEGFKEELSEKRGGVMMVGDGVNDAPALATADIGVAMGEGAALAMETSDVTLIDSHLNKLVYSITMGRRVLSKIQQNVVFSLVVKFAILGFAISGKVMLWMAILVDVGSMLIVTWNSMTLIPTKKKEEETVDGKKKMSTSTKSTTEKIMDETKDLSNNV